MGKRRPVSMPVNPACRAWDRHSSNETSSLNSGRSSFHQAIGAMPRLARMRSHSDALSAADFDLIRAGLLHGLARRYLGDTDIPTCVARHPYDGACDD